MKISANIMYSETMGNGSNFIDELIGSLDADLFGDLLDGFSDEQYSLFGGRDFVSVVSDVLSGNLMLDFSDVLSFVLSLIGSSLSSLVALLAAVIGATVIYSVVGAMEGGRHSESVSKAVHFAALGCVTAIAGAGVTAMFVSCAESLSSMSAQINALIPVMLTLMAGVGNTNTAAVFSPSVAVITGGLFNLITSVFVPMLIAAFVFGVIGNISSESGMGKMSAFMCSTVKWMFGTGFFLLTAVMSIQGITASVFDGIGVRGAKFAIGKYVPVIGGYMSEGFNLIVSGSIAVKNALGYTALVLLLLTILPVILQIAVFSLCLKLAAAIIEPLGDKRMSSVLAGMGNTVALTGGIMFGSGFLYFVFVAILMAAGNVFI